MLTGLRVLIYLLLAAVSLIVLVMTLRKKERSKLDSYMVLINVFLLFWLFFEIIINFTTNNDVAKFYFDIKLPFVALVTVSWFLYIVRFYGLEVFFPKPVVACLFVMPVFTMILAATTVQHSYIRESFEIFQLWPTLEYEQVRGPWFWIHSAVCYGLALVAVPIAIRQHMKLPKSQRLPSVILLTGLVVIFAGNIAVLLSNLSIDLSMVATAAMTVLLYQATLNHHGLDFMQRTRQEAFHQIDRAMFILDDKEEIVSMNRPAQAWLESEGFDDGGGFFQAVKWQIQQKSVAQRVLEEEESGTDYYFPSGEIFNMTQKPILDNTKALIGQYTIIANETNNRMLIDDLDRRSGIDALTGLSNRRQFESDVEFFTNEKVIPLSIIYGDLNNLKETNDELGHQQGDVLLRVVAEAIKRICPPSARIARIGGDEYIALLPNVSKEQAQSLVHDIKQALTLEDEQYPFTVSLAIGHVTKETLDQDIQELLDKADALMYEDKQAYKNSLL